MCACAEWFPGRACSGCVLQRSAHPSLAISERAASLSRVRPLARSLAHLFEVRMSDEKFDSRKTLKFRRPVPNGSDPPPPREEPLVSDASPDSSHIPPEEDLELRKTGEFHRVRPHRDDAG